MKDLTKLYALVNTVRHGDMNMPVEERNVVADRLLLVLAEYASLSLERDMRIAADAKHTQAKKELDTVMQNFQTPFAWVDVETSDVWLKSKMGKHFAGVCGENIVPVFTFEGDLS